MEENRLYRDLSWLWPLWGDPDGEYAEWCERVTRLIRGHATRETRTLLDVGCGGGKNAWNLKRAFEVTGIDASPAMLDLARGLNPECAFRLADMRDFDLGRRFDAILIDDAVSYLRNPGELRAAFGAARRHLAPGGVLVVAPDETTETFEQNRTRVSRAVAKARPAGLDVVFIENDYDPDPADGVYDALMVYLIREEGRLRVETDLHRLGLFPLSAWRAALGGAGFEVHEDRDPDRIGGLTFVCVVPEADGIGPPPGSRVRAGTAAPTGHAPGTDGSCPVPGHGSVWYDGCGRPAREEATMKADIWQLGISAADCDLTVTLNGFPVFRHRGPGQAGGGSPLNPLLIGAVNVLRVAVASRGPGASLSGRLTVTKGGRVTEVGGGPLALPEGEAREWTFDSEIAPLGKVLAGARVAAEPDMRAFAATLGAAFRAGDTAALLRLFAPKVEGYAEGYGQPREAMEAALAQGFGPFLGRDPGFAEADVEAVPHCGGKVFELRRRDGSPLLSVEEADGTTSMEVFAALLPGGPAVVA